MNNLLPKDPRSPVQDLGECKCTSGSSMLVAVVLSSKYKKDYIGSTAMCEAQHLKVVIETT
jgi:hypothetical protein